MRERQNKAVIVILNGSTYVGLTKELGKKHAMNTRCANKWKEKQNKSISLEYHVFDPLFCTTTHSHQSFGTHNQLLSRANDRMPLQSTHRLHANATDIHWNVKKNYSDARFTQFRVDETIKPKHCKLVSVLLFKIIQGCSYIIHDPFERFIANAPSSA